MYDWQWWQDGSAEPVTSFANENTAYTSPSTYFRLRYNIQDIGGKAGNVAVTFVYSTDQTNWYSPGSSAAWQFNTNGSALNNTTLSGTKLSSTNASAEYVTIAGTTSTYAASSITEGDISIVAGSSLSNNTLYYFRIVLAGSNVDLASGKSYPQLTINESVPSPSPTPSVSISSTPSISISNTPSISVSVTPSVSISLTPSITPTPTRTPSRTPSRTVSRTPSLSISSTRTPSRTPSSSVPAASISRTPSRTPSKTPPSGYNYTVNRYSCDGTLCGSFVATETITNAAQLDVGYWYTLNTGYVIEIGGTSGSSGSSVTIVSGPWSECNYACGT